MISYIKYLIRIITSYLKRLFRDFQIKEQTYKLEESKRESSDDVKNAKKSYDDFMLALSEYESTGATKDGLRPVVEEMRSDSSGTKKGN